MEKAIKIHVGGGTFLLPEPGPHSNYIFPTYILEHKDDIERLVEGGGDFAKDPLNFHSNSAQDLSTFRSKTGIIGFPFDARDPDLFAANEGVEILLEIEL